MHTPTMASSRHLLNAETRRSVAAERSDGWVNRREISHHPVAVIQRHSRTGLTFIYFGIKRNKRPSWQGGMAMGAVNCKKELDIE